MSTSLNITSIDATAVLVADDLFPQGIDLQEFAADASVGIGNVTFLETRQGVDGKLAAGKIPELYTVTVSLEAGSGSAKQLGQLADAMRVNRRPYWCTLVFTVPSLGEVYTFKGGALKEGTVVPSAKKVLDPTTWTFEFPELERSAI